MTRYHSVSGGAGSWLATKVDMDAHPHEEHRFGRHQPGGRAMAAIIQVMKIVSHDVPKPYRLVETYLTSEGMRTRVCSGCYGTMGEAEFQRETLEKIVAGGGQE